MLNHKLRSLLSILSIAQMRRRDSKSASADTVTRGAVDQHLVLRDLADGLSIVGVTEDLDESVNDIPQNGTACNLPPHC